MTWATVSGLSIPGRLKARDTVDRATPAARATCPMVGTDLGGWFIDAR